MNIKSQNIFMYFFLFLMQLITIKFINNVNEIKLNNYATKMEKRDNYEFRLIEIKYSIKYSYVHALTI